MTPSELDDPGPPMAAFASGAEGRADRTRGIAVVVCVAIPVVVLVVSYVWLALDHGTVFLGGVVVHESGQYTLGQTILYFGHFLREVPIAVAYALFLLSASGHVDPGSGSRAERTFSSARWTALLAASGLVGIAFLVTSLEAGVGSAFQDLLQYRTRDDLAGYGTHWRYHWLSTLWFGAVAAVAPAVTRRVPGLPGLGVSRFWARAAWVYFGALTLIFGMSTDVFVDARYAGHQAREIMTHGPVTLLLGVGMLLAWKRAGSTGAATRDAPAWMKMIFYGVVFLVPVHLAAVSLSGDVMAQGQSDLGLSAMVAAHYFEHSLDYTLVLLLLWGGLAHGGSRLQPGRQHATSVPAA